MFSYISEIILRASERTVTSASVALKSISGQTSSVLRHSVSKANGIRIPVKGNAIRFVSRKCVGNVPKYKYAMGPVVSWHDIDNAAESQIHLNPSLFPVERGQNPFSHGYMKAMPAIAAYDSWKPTELNDCGAMQSCMTNADKRSVPVSQERPECLAASRRIMNRNALTMESPAPVARVYMPQRITMAVERALVAAVLLPMIRSTFEVRL